MADDTTPGPDSPAKPGLFATTRRGFLKTFGLATGAAALNLTSTALAQ